MFAASTAFPYPRLASVLYALVVCVADFTVHAEAHRPAALEGAAFRYGLSCFTSSGEGFVDGGGEEVLERLWQSSCQFRLELVLGAERSIVASEKRLLKLLHHLPFQGFGGVGHKRKIIIPALFLLSDNDQPQVFFYTFYILGPILSVWYFQV